MSEKLYQGRTAARVGDRAEARRLLAAAAEETPDNPEVWLELAGVVESPEEKKSCLEKVLALDPDNAQAQATLALLERKLATVAGDGRPQTADPSISANQQPWAVSGPPSAVELGPLYCYRHPQVETSLRCNRCNKPICPKCAQRTPVGFRCPDCRQEIEGRYYNQLQGGYILPYEFPPAKPFFTYVFMGAIGLVFLAQVVAGGSNNDGVLISFGANYGPGILQGEVWRLFTSMFLHVDTQHLVFNSIGLLAFGFEMERLYGRWRYVVIYLLSGLFGSLASFSVHGPATYSAGASGAIFGVVGMQAAFFLFYRHRLGEFGRQRRNMALILMGLSLALGFSGIMPSDNWAHLGGFIAGFIFGYLLTPRYWVDPAASPRRIVDRGSLRRRWWVLLLGVAALTGSLWLALSFWSGGWWGGAPPSSQESMSEFGGGAIEYGQTATGNLTHPNGDIWTFTGKEGQIVTITANSDAFDAYVALYDANDRLLIENDDNEGELNARIAPFILPQSGLYSLYVGSMDDQAGAYELNLSLLGEFKSK